MNYEELGLQKEPLMDYMYFYQQNEFKIRVFTDTGNVWLNGKIFIRHATEEQIINLMKAVRNEQP